MTAHPPAVSPGGRDAFGRGIGPMSAPRPADLYAERIREQIFSGELPAGSQLPSERVIGESTGLTRAAVRDALAQLQSQGLITTKLGRNGGSVVTELNADTFKNSVDLHLQGWAPRLDMLEESRTVIEPWCAYLAAQRRTDDDVEALSAIDEESEQALVGNGNFLDCKLRWHSALVAATHNDVLSTFVQALCTSIARQSEPFYLLGDQEAMAVSVDEHRMVTDAIRRRDSASAHHLMSVHVRAPEIAT